jgi:hypothetical protein
MIFWSLCAFIWFKNIEKMLLQMISDFLQLESTIQGVSEISRLIFTGNRTHQKEQLFSLPFWRKTLRSGLKK